MFNPFSALTSKIFMGSTLALGLALGYVVVTKNAVISHQDKQINDPKTGFVVRIDRLRKNNATLRGNQHTLENGINACNSSVTLAAEAAERASAVGTTALAEVRKSDARTAAAIDRIRAMPVDGATPAAQCEQADAIMLEGARQ